MRGRTQEISVKISRADQRYQGSVELIPTRWGIPPFKAVGGTIKLQDRVRVEFDLDSFVRAGEAKLCARVRDLWLSTFLIRPDHRLPNLYKFVSPWLKVKFEWSLA